jgi:hypothetical protein
MRRAAVDPDDVTSSSLSLDSLLNDDFMALPSGSIVARLEVLDGRDITSLQEYTGLSSEDFSQARSYLAQEIKTFERDRSVTFVPDSLGAIPQGVSFFAATGQEPIPPPPEYFAALARKWDQ